MGDLKREEKVLETAVRHMEKLKGERLSELDRPDRRERQRKAVDLVTRSMSSVYVLEHTRIESFTDQIEDDQQFLDILGPVVAMIGDDLPEPGKYVLVVEPYAVKGAKQTGKIQQSLSSWVKSKAPSLEIGPTGASPRNFARGYPPGVSFQVTLYRFPGRSGRLRIGRSVLQNLEEERARRVRSAFDAKCPKLGKAKMADGRISVLELESDDMALANHFFITEAVLSSARTRGTDVPDEIYLVETEVEPWTVWTIKYGSDYYPAVPQPASLSGT